MRYKKLARYATVLAALAAPLITGSSWAGEQETASITPRQSAAYRDVSRPHGVAKEIVNRLQYEENVINTSEDWKDDKALPLPARRPQTGARSTVLVPTSTAKRNRTIGRRRTVHAGATGLTTVPLPTLVDIILIKGASYEKPIFNSIICCSNSVSQLGRLCINAT